MAAERVRLLDHEAADVHRAVEDYLDAVEISDEESHTYGNIIAATDLVNAIGEIYETALARAAADHPQPFSFPLPPPRGAAG